MPKKALFIGGTIRGSILPQKMLKIRCSRLAKNAFAIQYLLHHSIVYTFTHYRTIMMDALIIAFLRSSLQYKYITFFLLVRIFPLNFSFYLNYYNYLFSSQGKYLLGTQNIFWDQWSHGPPLQGSIAYNEPKNHRHRIF